MEPDRWAEERRRGMTIDLGFAWTMVEDEVVGFVDVPGHQRFLGNMLAGLGPSPAVLFVVAADEGWCRQSAEHLAAVDGLGLRHALLAVTRSDLADPSAATEQALREIARSSLGDVPAVAVSGTTGSGLDELRRALRAMLRVLPKPAIQGPVRLWVDRSFTIRGAGTVVTGTLAGGCLQVGDVVQVGGREVVIRGLQSLGEPCERVSGVARVAVNLRGVDRDQVSRGDALLTGTWRHTDCVDVRLAVDGLPRELVLHVGTAAMPVGVRELGPGSARLRLDRPLPLEVGDRGLLREPASQRVLGGVVVLDTEPPRLDRRGAAARRATDLAQAPVDARLTAAWKSALRARDAAPPPLYERQEVRSARALAGTAEAAVSGLEARLAQDPFEAPSGEELSALGLGRKQLAAALAVGRLLVLGEVVLLPSAVVLAAERLAACVPPFSVADARQALGCRRPVAVALLEELDRVGVTRRLAGGVRELVSAPG
jgi:selenocysteine-specific elongation factor